MWTDGDVAEMRDLLPKRQPKKESAAEQKVNAVLKKTESIRVEMTKRAEVLQKQKTLMEKKIAFLSKLRIRKQRAE